MTYLKPTDEQSNIVNAAKKILTGTNNEKGLKAIAFAGAGKTSTMTMIGEELCEMGFKGMYLAFNKDIAMEAKRKMPPGVDARTFHSLAYVNTHPAIKSKLNNRKGLFPKNFGVDFKVKDFGIKGDTRKSKIKGKANDNIWMSNYRQYIVVKAAMDNFLLDMTDMPEKHHIMNSCNRVLKAIIDDENKEMLAGRLLESLRKLWVRFQDVNDDYAINPNVYLKLWALSEPIIDVDFILFDEAQDSDKLMLDVLSRQKAKIIYVGDPHQQIYEWRGAVNAMKSIYMQSYYLTQSFRFGQEIADYAGNMLTFLGESNIMTGANNKEGFVNTTCDYPTDINAILCRTNIGAIEAVLEYAINTSLRVVPSNIDIKDTIQLLHDIESFRNEDKNFDVSKHFILSNFNNYKEMQRFVEEFSFDTVISPTVKLYNEYGYDRICEILSKAERSNKNDPNVIIATTAHKSKGLEWDGVLIWDDFKGIMHCNDMEEYLNSDGEVDILKDRPPINDSEARLLYVTMTRAKTRLYSHHVDILIRYLDKKAGIE
ncbi:MAG: ATP-dependent helicase [Psychrobacter sp.]|nr:ATP-dependent helicase [Psychrobacter sp.]